MELDYIKAKPNGLWFYTTKGEIILIIESKDLDTLESAIKVSREVAKKTGNDYTIPINPLISIE